MLALKLAYNLYEAGKVADAKLAEVEEMARRRVAWYISVGRLALMELGAEFVKPEDKPKNKERTWASRMNNWARRGGSRGRKYERR